MDQDDIREALRSIDDKLDIHKSDVIVRLARLEAVMPKQPCVHFTRHEAEHERTLQRSFVRECIGMALSGVAGVVSGVLAALHIKG